MIQLRDYQQQVYNKCRDAYAEGYKHIAVWSPTGSGKSIIFMYMIWQAVQKGNRVLVLVTRDTLQDQVAEYCEQFNIEYGIIHHTFKRNNAPVQISIVDSFISRLEPFDMICVDECHLSAAQDFMVCLNYLKEHGASILGFSATIRRLDGIGLGDHVGGAFQTIVRGPEMQWLIDNGYLVDCDIYAPRPADMMMVRGDDYNINSYLRESGGPQRLSNAVSMWEKYAKNKLTVAFTCNIQDARNVRDEFISAGYKTETLHSKKKSKQDEILEKFRNREIDILVTVDLVSYGFDLPNIECALCMRPTMSETLYLQQLGRVLRPVYASGDKLTAEARKARIAESSKPTAIVLDLAGNLYLHGFPTDKREWTLDGRRNKESVKGETFISVALCGSCGRNYNAALERCPVCGAGRAQKKRAIKQASGELILVTQSEYDTEMQRRKEEEAKRAKEEQEKQARSELLRERKKAAKTLEEYEQIERDFGFKSGWGFLNYGFYMQARKKYARK